MGGIIYEESVELFTLTSLTPQEAKQRLPPVYGRRRGIILAGPTASGKTELSLLLAKQLGGEIISADSMQVYRGMDIGTAKVSLEIRQQVPHHLIDIRDVQESFNAVDFYYAARDAVESICARNRVPIIVGGSGFYLRVFLVGPPPGPSSVREVRLALEAELEQIGADAFYHKLLECDPEYAKTITPRDRHKLVRAMEIIQITGHKVSKFQWKARQDHVLDDFHCWFLTRSRENLYHRIEKRCDQMLEAGFVDEVVQLEQQGLRQNSAAAQAIGYRQCLEYLASDKSSSAYQQFISTFKSASKHYAKRQFTWFRNEPQYRWMDLEMHDAEVAADMIAKDFTQII